eukprot:2588580-Prymnesium_polylepis.1
MWAFGIGSLLVRRIADDQNAALSFVMQVRRASGWHVAWMWIVKVLSLFVVCDASEEASGWHVAWSGLSTRTGVRPRLGCTSSY